MDMKDYVSGIDIPPSLDIFDSIESEPVSPSESPLPVESPAPFPEDLGYYTLMSDISDLSLGIQELASYLIPQYGYFNSSTLDALDRAVAGSDKRYYLSYRYDADTYNGYLYLSNDVKVSGNQIDLEDVTLINIYRYRYNSSYQYEYRYDISILSDVSLSVDDSLFYTNILDGYPILGGRTSPKNLDDSLILIYVIILLLFVIILALFKNSRRV